MILHLERKFTSPTETFIGNQINFQKKYKSITFTVKHLNNLNIDTEVFAPNSKSFLAAKLLTKGEVNQFLEVYNKKIPSLLHGHFLTDSAFFHSFSKHLRIPKVCSAYGYDVSSFPNMFWGLGKIYLKTVFNEYDAFLAMSNDMANDLIKLGCNSNKIIVHYHGINTEFFDIKRSYGQKEEFNILTIASLVEKKGHINVLKALRELNNQHPQIKFKYNIVGKGPLLGQLTNFVKENNLQNKVNFCGLIKHGDDLLDVIKKADVFVHPSVTDKHGNKEGIPGALVEAMASGLPVVSTYHAGIPEIVTDGVDGFLLKENDFIGITNLLYKLYTQEELRTSVGTAAKRTAIDKLDVRLKSKDLEKIYAELLIKKAEK